MRQRDLEIFIGLCRQDPFTGGELISCYQEYLKTAGDPLLETLMLHNREDMEGMLALLPLLAIPALTEGTLPFRIRGDAAGEHAHIQLTLPFSLPVSLDRTLSDIRLVIKDRQATLTVPFFSGTLKFFYENYKDYYYPSPGGRSHPQKRGRLCGPGTPPARQSRRLLPPGDGKIPSPVYAAVHPRFPRGIPFHPSLFSALRQFLGPGRTAYFLCAPPAETSEKGLRRQKKAMEESHVPIGTSLSPMAFSVLLTLLRSLPQREPHSPELSCSG